MEEKIDITDCELFLLIEPNCCYPVILKDRTVVADCLINGRVSHAGPRQKCRVFTFPGLVEVTKARIKILLQEKE